MCHENINPENIILNGSKIMLNDQMNIFNENKFKIDPNL